LQSIEKLFSKRSVKGLRNEISSAEGREIFFLGKTNAHRRVIEIKAIARGDEEEVPAIQQVAAPGDVVIHNHPSGDLKPSKADLQLASLFGQRGIGCYIINNEVTLIYVVIEAFEKIELQPLKDDKIISLLSPGEEISQKLSNYEYRLQQMEMMKAVIKAFNHDKIGIIEAGTGTGKTLAYLLPTIFWSAANKERVVISTNTINLQEQLLYKDIPFLRQVLPQKFKAVLVKGRGNYVCLRKIGALQKDFNLFSDEDDSQLLQDIIKWSSRTSDGSISDLNFIPPGETWEKVKSETDLCLRSKCPYFKQCFVNRARRELSQADLLIVNHHLLFSDLALRRQLGPDSELSILPAYQRLILDEAHNLEDVVTSHFGSHITRIGLFRMLNRLYHLKKGEKGLLPIIKLKLFQVRKNISESTLDGIINLIDAQFIPQVKITMQAAEIAFDKIAKFLSSQQIEKDAPELKQRITPDIQKYPDWQLLVKQKIKDVKAELHALISQMEKLSKSLARLKNEIKEEIEDQILQLKAMAGRFREVKSLISSIFGQHDEGEIRWILSGGDKKPGKIELLTSPLIVADEMIERVFYPYGTVILTSATLTIGGNFDFIKTRLGLDKIESERLIELVLPSPFNYEKQAIIAIPSDVPEPRSHFFEEELPGLLLKTISISQGSAFILFTSFALLNSCFRRLEESLRLMGITPLKQGEEGRHRLLERFKKDISSVLFATDSFWEGVDVEGEALQCVILTKLPFKVPNDPVMEARMEYIEKHGGNPFMELAVPLAVIRFKQGLGRLIRRKTDRGAIVILDKRIKEKNYGKAFLHSLPKANLIIDKKEIIFDNLRNFFVL
jgi:ATP-dependent DNA helicase DinG